MKSCIRGDILIDDKPMDVMAPQGCHTAATWKQVIFDAPYNQQSTLPRLRKWVDWKSVIQPLLGKKTAEDPYLLEYGEPSPCLSQKSPVLHFPLEDENVPLRSVNDILGAYRQALTPDEDGGTSVTHKSLTLTDDSDTFIEDYKELRRDAEMQADSMEGLDGLKKALNKIAKERVKKEEKNARDAAIAGGAEDAMDAEVFRQSYRQWRKESFVSTRK